MANDWLDSYSWPSGKLSGVERNALDDIETLIGTGELRCPSSGPIDVDYRSQTISQWSRVDHATVCSATAACHRVAKLGQAGRLLEAARYAIETSRSQSPVCDVWPAMRQHLKEQMLRYLQAVVTELACHTPADLGHYAELCWDRSYDDGEQEGWELRTDMFATSAHLHEADGGLSVDGWLEVAGAWQGHWSPHTGWEFAYLWAGRRWEAEWPAARQWNSRTPQASVVAAELAKFLDTDPLSSPCPDDDGYEDWLFGDVWHDEDAARLADELRAAAEPKPATVSAPVPQ